MVRRLPASPPLLHRDHPLLHQPLHLPPLHHPPPPPRFPLHHLHHCPPINPQFTCHLHHKRRNISSMLFTHEVDLLPVHCDFPRLTEVGTHSPLLPPALPLPTSFYFIQRNHYENLTLHINKYPNLYSLYSYSKTDLSDE